MLKAYADYAVDTLKIFWIEIQIFWIDVQLAFRR